MNCTRLRDRIPDAVSGVAPWSEAERTHVEGCSACRAEIALVQQVRRFDAPGALAEARIIARVPPALRSRRLRHRPFPVGVVGFAALAACLALLVLARPDRTRTAEPSAPPILPELERLSEPELRQVLELLPGEGPLLEGPVADLTDEELRAIFRPLEG